MSTLTPQPLTLEPQTPQETAPCFVCGDPVTVALPADWQAQVEAGASIPIVGCGNPWHYGLGEPGSL